MTLKFILSRSTKCKVFGLKVYFAINQAFGATRYLLAQRYKPLCNQTYCTQSLRLRYLFDILVNTFPPCIVPNKLLQMHCHNKGRSIVCDVSSKWHH